MVKGQAVGKSQVVFHQDSPIRPVHVGHLNFRPVPVPVRPVQAPEQTGRKRVRPSAQLTPQTPVVGFSPVRVVRDDGSGIDQIRVEQDPALAAVQLGDLHGVTHGVGPEEETGHVVDGDAFRTLET